VKKLEICLIYTIVIENVGVLPANLKDAEITVKRGNRILDEWTWEFSTFNNQNEINPGEKTQLVPYLQTVNFGVGQIEITAVISGYDFLDASIIKSGYSCGPIITFGESDSDDAVAIPIARIFQFLLTINSLLKN